MSEICPPTFDLPPELWICIHRLATSHLSPLATVYAERDAPEDSETPISSFFKAVSSIARVCKLWRGLAQELLYENIHMAASRSLLDALDQPELARRVRSICIREKALR
ncbi:hypothetical protein C8R46DRAFT_1361865 [Mycena filopes]|nr:hypothetical protein C8R46DRAFT_1361865 [Mycena filopes]